MARKQVEEAVELFRRTPPVGTVDVVEHFLGAGLDLLTASQLGHLVPLAFCRYALRHSGVEFSNFYRVLGEADPRPLNHEPIYCEALSLAESIAAGPDGSAACLAIARRSPEFQAINARLHGGSTLDQIALGEPVLVARSAAP